jgi:hypothetical protein
MPSNTTTWRFTQLGGRKRTLVLADHAAPFGAPRRGTIVTDTVELREEEVHYDGDTPPTRHIFGLRYQPLELNGRFTDLRGGAGFARAKTAEVKQFVAEMQPVLVEWDDLVRCRGLITIFAPNREAGSEVEWELTVRVDGDDLLTAQPKFPTEQRSPGNFLNSIQLAMVELDEIKTSPPTLRSDVFDVLDSLIASVNAATAAVASVASEIDSYANAPFTLMRRFRYGLEQLGTAVAKLRDTYDDFRSDSALESEAADDTLQFLNLQARWSSSLHDVLRQIILADDAAARTEAGETLAFHAARDGDSWDSLSRQYYGSAARAEEIRKSNSVPAGQQPIPGTTYRIPR